jgi:hypothetical protein
VFFCLVDILRLKINAVPMAKKSTENGLFNGLQKLCPALAAPTVHAQNNN